VESSALAPGGARRQIAPGGCSPADNSGIFSLPAALHRAGFGESAEPRVRRDGRGLEVWTGCFNQARTPSARCAPPANKADVGRKSPHARISSTREVETANPASGLWLCAGQDCVGRRTAGAWPARKAGIGIARSRARGFGHAAQVSAFG